MYSVYAAPSTQAFPPVAGLSLREKDLEVRLARGKDDLEAAQRLRFEVFNLEMRLGLAGSFADGLDRDAFDAHCDHLVVVDHRQKGVVGTYRLAPASAGANSRSCAKSAPFSANRTGRSLNSG